MASQRPPFHRFQAKSIWLKAASSASCPEIVTWPLTSMASSTGLVHNRARVAKSENTAAGICWHMMGSVWNAQCEELSKETKYEEGRVFLAGGMLRLRKLKSAELILLQQLVFARRRGCFSSPRLRFGSQGSRRLVRLSTAGKHPFTQEAAWHLLTVCHCRSRLFMLVIPLIILGSRSQLCFAPLMVLLKHERVHQGPDSTKMSAETQCISGADPKDGQRGSVQWCKCSQFYALHSSCRNCSPTHREPGQACACN